ncbi:hypothetical protein DFH28DRAFT_1016174 [Melampsora americana]|nr:hypothetical protein DFH28DRAFT_1016174 [Melampsora americana]
MNSIQKILSLLLLTFPFSFTINHKDLNRESLSFTLLEKRQSTLTLPDCGQNCYTLALPDLGTCAESDTACICQDGGFMNSAQECFQTTCAAEDIAMIITLGQQTCLSLGTTFFQINGITDGLTLPAGDSVPRTSLFSSPSLTPIASIASAPIDTPTSTAVSSLPTSSSIPSDDSTSSSDRPTSTNQPSPFSDAPSVSISNLYYFFIIALVIMYLL